MNTRWRLLGLLVVLSLSAGHPAQPAQAQVLGPTVDGCRPKGRPTMPWKVPVFDVPEGGHAVAQFTGNPSSLAVVAFPSDSSGHRVNVVTGLGAGDFRVNGYLETDALPLYTVASVSIVPGHLWLPAHSELRVLQWSGSKLLVEKQIIRPFRQSFTVWLPCGAVELGPVRPARERAPSSGGGGDAQNYVVQVDQLELFDLPLSSSGADGQGTGGQGRGSDESPKQSLVAVLEEAQGLVLKSTERKGIWARVEYHGEIGVDAWVRTSAIELVPELKTQDEAVDATNQPSSQHLELKQIPRRTRVEKALKFRLLPAEGARFIGTIEPGTRVYVLDVVAGWASVLPETLQLAPPAEGQFWVLAADLGLGRGQ